MRCLVVCSLACAVISAQANVRVSIDVGDELPLVKPSESIGRLKSIVFSDASAGTISFEIKDIFGEEVRTTRPLEFRNGRAVVPVLDGSLKNGAYDVFWACTVGDEVSKGVQRIAVCDDLGPSEGFGGEFLFGTHAHLQCCRNRHEQELEVRAAARAGFKVMRVDFAWRAIEREKGVCDWRENEDRVCLLEKYGIFPQALVGMAPDWAVRKNWIYERADRGPCGNKLPEDGLWHDFLFRMAEHFGSRIPFYELYNEPDLVGFGNFSVSDYVASFNAGARGVHGGCSSAKVLTGGIACWRVTTDTKKDFLPQGVLGTVAEFDVLAIHEHGGPEGYFGALDKNWVPFLKKHGIKKPIWPNETSEDGMRGEAAQAACYFQKALFSWSRGCCAHNWYKVRDAKRDLSETRRAFGLLSRDFEPLAAYPAVAGTISVYRDAHFVCEIPNEDMELLLFSKKRNLILAGWPHKPGGAVMPRPVKIRTDAIEAFFVDLMGNPQPVPMAEGTVKFDVGRYVGSLVLRGATKAEAIANPPLPRSAAQRIPVTDGKFTTAPQLVLDKPEHYTSLAGYNPATDHLMWRGPADLSARYWFRRDGDMLTVRAEVTDDIVCVSPTEVPHAGDVMALVFLIDGKRHFFWVKSKDGHAYEHVFSLPELGWSPGCRTLFNTRVWDNDDGVAVEGHIGIASDLNGENSDEWAELELR